ncbi:MAG: hypothetical protein ABJI96_04370 [Paracoccaceae bacterium]
MTIKTFLITAALTVLPGIAMAVGCVHGKERQAMSCAQGSAWDYEAQACKPVANS